MFRQPASGQEVRKGQPQRTRCVVRRFSLFDEAEPAAIRVMLLWQRRELAVSLEQVVGIGRPEEAVRAIADWHYGAPAAASSDVRLPEAVGSTPFHPTLDGIRHRGHRNYIMAALRLKLARIGNSRGVRLPATVLRRYGMQHHVQAELTPEGVLLKSTRSQPEKLSWSEAGRAMAAAAEDWSDWDAATGDGLDRL